MCPPRLTKLSVGPVSFRLSSGGTMPYVGQDLMQFPLARPSQGVLDLVVQEVVSFKTSWSSSQRQINGI